jgi:hypothetical protein
MEIHRIQQVMIAHALPCHESVSFCVLHKIVKDAISAISAANFAALHLTGKPPVRMRR